MSDTQHTDDEQLPADDLCSRLLAHARIHDGLSTHSSEQAQWADDLREAESLIRNLRGLLRGGEGKDAEIAEDQRSVTDMPRLSAEQLPADAPLMCPRHDCESTRHALNQLRVENKHLREDLARYENGRVVMTAEIEALREKLHEAQQLAMRQANQIRKLEKTIDNLNDVIIEEGL